MPPAGLQAVTNFGSCILTCQPRCLLVSNLLTYIRRRTYCMMILDDLDFNSSLVATGCPHTCISVFNRLEPKPDPDVVYTACWGLQLVCKTISDCHGVKCGRLESAGIRASNGCRRTGYRFASHRSGSRPKDGTTR